MAATAAFSADPSALAEAVSERAMALLLADLRRFGSRVSHDHEAALRTIVSTYSLLAAALDTGRIVFDLDVGMGKTRSVVAWVTALLELGAPWSVVIAGERVEALADIYRALVEERSSMPRWSASATRRGTKRRRLRPFPRAIQRSRSTTPPSVPPRTTTSARSSS